MSLATLLTHLDRQAYIALVAVSRPEQRDYLLRQIDAGENVFEYTLRAELPGDYHVLPARAGCAYIPEIWGSSAERRVRIRE